MPIDWYQPRKRASSSELNIVISQQFISLNEAIVNKYFKDKERVKIGYDKDAKKLFLVPVEKDDKNGMKIIKNVNSTSRYLNAKGVFYKYGLTDTDKKITQELRAAYKCSWDSSNNSVVIDLENDKLK